MFSQLWCLRHMSAGQLGERNNTSWLGLRVNRGFRIWDLLKFCFCIFFLAIRCSQIISTAMGIKGLPGHWIVQLCSISQGDCIFGAIGVDKSSSRRASRDVLASWAVLRAVFRVFTCLSMKPFEQQKYGEEVMWSMHCPCRNLSNSSAIKGRPLSV